MFKKLLKTLIGEKNLGRIEYFRAPEMRASWGGPFNGQRFRQRIFTDLMYFLPIKAIVETGTFRGTTTAMFAATTLPVFTVEAAARYFAYVKARFLLGRQNIALYHDDSRAFLKTLSQDSSMPKEDVFFYLDAHWGGDLPLREELNIIFSNWTRAVVMIDDFEVPNSAYEFDDYGSGKVLNLEYLQDTIAEFGVSAFFPSASAKEETGARRGSVVLCQGDLVEPIERNVITLKEHIQQR